jgi:putative endonuclease
MKNGHNYYVYIIQCSDGSYYTGVTNDLERRLWEHETGYNTKCYTFTRRPVALKYNEHFTNINNAIAWENR